MARILFPPIGIVYDTDKQVGKLHQVVERFSLGTLTSERCVIVGIAFDEGSGYIYTLIGLRTLQRFNTRFIFSEKNSICGVYTDFIYPSYMDAEVVESVISRSAAYEQARRQRQADVQRRLHRGALIVDYSERALAIFTDDPADVSVLEHIRAKWNPGLKYQGRKVAGWVFPKCRQEQLAAVVTP